MIFLRKIGDLRVHIAAHSHMFVCCGLFFFQAENGIRDHCVTGVQTCALPIFATQREDQLSTPFSGTKTNTTYSTDAGYDALMLTSAGITAGTGEYAFASTLDLEDVYSLDLERRIVSRGIYPELGRVTCRARVLSYVFAVAL